MQFVKSIPLTFYSRDFYLTLLLRGCGIGFGFMLLQAVLLLSVPIIQIIPVLPTVKEKVTGLAQQLPEIIVKDHKLSIDKPSPYSIDLTPDSKVTPQPIILFDTSSTLTNISDIDQMMKGRNVVALITADYFATPKAGNMDAAIEIHSIRDYAALNNGGKVTHDQWNTLGQKLLTWGEPIALALMAASLMLGILIATFLKGLILLVATLFCTIRPSLAATMRLSAAASMPGGILMALSSLAHVPLPRFTEMALWAIFSLYAIIVANKSAKLETIH